MTERLNSAAIEAVANDLQRRIGEFDLGDADFAFLAERALSAALDTGSLIAVPEDAVERVDAAVGEVLEPEALNYSGIRNAVTRAALQALGLLPEQEEWA